MAPQPVRGLREDWRVSRPASDLLDAHDVAHIRANNPGPFTLTGTNTWIVGRDPAWVIDPGPSLDDHLAALAVELRARGGLGGVLLTHDHPDHAEGVPALLERVGPAPLAAGRGEPDIRLEQGAQVGPLRALATPGHAPDHFAFVLGGEGAGAAGVIGFTGDAVLGSGSSLLIPNPGALAGYLAGLERLRASGLAVIAPGHGPLVEDPDAKLEEYVGHRLERERNVVAALDAGLRTVDELLDAVWSEAPPALRRAAAVTLAAHLDKLADEGRLPEGVERPPWPIPLGSVGR
jgi:glyoxylase-like metal-dependent hydrolase (beta-lactamase superfamily II)